MIRGRDLSRLNDLVDHLADPYFKIVAYDYILKYYVGVPISETIEEALGSPAKIRVLRFLKKPGAGLMSIRQLARRTLLNPVTLSRTLQSLRELGVVDYVQAGRSQLWRMMPSYATILISPVLDQLGNSPALSKIVADFIMLEKPVPSEILEIILFGSAASGEATASSDIDLCLLLKSEPRTLRTDQFCDGLRQKISEELGMRLSPVFISKKRFRLLKEPLRSHIRAGLLLYAKDKDKTDGSI